MQLSINRIMEGKMGNDFRPAFEVYVDGECVATVKRKWHAHAIGAALFARNIPATGDVVAAFDKWAYEHDRTLFDRIGK